MIINIDEYNKEHDRIEKEKIKKFLRILKIHFYLFKKNIKKPLQQFLKFFASCIGGLIVFKIICISASYDSYDESAIPFWVVVLFYIGLIINHIGIKQLYKNWEQQAEYNEFQKRFCQEYKPKIFDDLICFWLGLKFFNTPLFICLIFALCINDTWNRRYITNNIKHDLILEKLNKINS